MDSSKKGGGIVMLVVSLGLITLVCAFLLGLVNQVTAPLIDKNTVKTRNEAMAEIIADAQFEELEVPEEISNPEEKNEVPITGAYLATRDSERVGYCFEVKPSGFGGELSLIVGINLDETVAGVQVTSHAETPGLGAKAQTDADWVAQFVGKAADGALAVSKDGGTIDAITGATITSRAVISGVNAAAAYAATLE